MDKAESVKLELKTFDEIFGEGSWDNDEAEDLKTPAPTNFEQNVSQIDRQNTQIGQIEPNSTDQNPPLNESDHSDNAEDERKLAKELGLGVTTIYKWKRKLGQTKPNKYPHSKQKELIKLYYEIKHKKPKISDVDIAKMLKIGKLTMGTALFKKITISAFLGLMLILLYVNTSRAVEKACSLQTLVAEGTTTLWGRQAKKIYCCFFFKVKSSCLRYIQERFSRCSIRIQCLQP
uniref:Uncharacterized protein n=1 Tax=Globodera rostochiensis TaxID=31243 RepID=A0A914HPH6_GLORO